MLAKEDSGYLSFYTLRSIKRSDVYKWHWSASNYLAAIDKPMSRFRQYIWLSGNVQIHNKYYGSYSNGWVGSGGGGDGGGGII